MKRFTILFCGLVMLLLTSRAQAQCSAAFSWNVVYSTLGGCPEIRFNHIPLAGQGSTISYHWDFGDGNISSQPNPIYVYGSSNTYSVCLTIITDNFCMDTYCYPVVVNCGSQCDAMFGISGNSPVISFNDLSTSNPAMIGSWFWDFGDGGTSTLQNPTHFYAANWNYPVCLTITSIDGSCTSTYCDTIDISFYTCNVDFSYTYGLCPEVSFFSNPMSNFGIIHSFDWDFGDGNTFQSTTLAFATHSYSANGTYVVSHSITAVDNIGNNCSSIYTDTIQITCLPTIQCQANMQVSPGLGPQVLFTDQSTASPGTINSWLWDFGDGDTSNLQSPTHLYTANGTYNACLTISTTDSCTSTYCETVLVTELGIEDPKVFQSLKLFPNPMQNQLTIDFGTITEDDVRLSFYDITGRLVHLQNVPTGTLSVQVNTTDLSNGVYTLKLETNKTAVSKHVVVSK